MRLLLVHAVHVHGCYYGSYAAVNGSMQLLLGNYAAVTAVYAGYFVYGSTGSMHFLSKGIEYPAKYCVFKYSIDCKLYFAH